MKVFHLNKGRKRLNVDFGIGNVQGRGVGQAKLTEVNDKIMIIIASPLKDSYKYCLQQDTFSFKYVTFEWINPNQ